MASVLDQIPQDQEAEQAVLGSILLDNNSINEVMGILNPESFYLPAHQVIYTCILSLIDEDTPMDEITIGDKLKTQGRLEECGGYSYLNEVKDLVPTAGNIKYYANIVRDQALLRDLIETTSDIAQQTRDPNRNVSALLATAGDKINEIATRSGDRSYSHIKDVLINNFDRLEKLSENEDEITGLETGFTDLDKLTSGFQSSDLIIVAARPSMGKTAFALNIAHYAATNLDKNNGVLVFSLEMSNEQLANRLLVGDAKIPTERLRTGNLETDDWDKLAQSTEKLSKAPIYMTDIPGLSVYELNTIAKQLYKDLDGNIGLIIVDYLQLMTGGRQTLSREQEIAEISRNLKGLAKELDIPVVALSQLNRALENRSDKRPQMSDLRESGAIEQDADIIMFIYRDEVYNEDSPDKGIAELIIAKHRNGSLGKIRLAFLGQYTKFANFTMRDDSAPPQFN